MSTWGRLGTAQARGGRLPPIRPTAGWGIASWAAGLVACGLATVPIGWDGAIYAYLSLQHGRAWTAPARPAAQVLEWPTVWLTQITDDLGVLRLVFSLPWALTPLLTLWLVAVVTRGSEWRSRRWIAVVGITVVLLPGQPYFVSEATWCSHLAWPLLLAAAGGARRTVWPLIALAGAAMLALHPTSALLLTVVALAWSARALGWIDGPPAARPALVVAASSLLIVVGVVRMVRYQIPYEATMTDPGRVIDAVSTGLSGIHGLAYLLALAAIGLVLVGPASSAPVVLATLVLSVPAWLWWATHPPLWWNAILFRYAAAPATVVVMVLTVWSWRTGARPPSAAVLSTRRWLTTCGSTLAGLCLVVIAVGWLGEVDRVERRLAAAPSGCIEEEFPPLSQRTAADHTIQHLSVLLGERRSDQVILFRGLNGTCRDYCRTGLNRGPALSHTPDVRHWFDLEGTRQCHQDVP